MNSRILVATMAGIVLTAGGCSSQDASRGEAVSPTDEYIYDGASVVALDSAENTVTWSDTVAVFTVLSERASNENPDEEEAVITGRLVTVQIDDVVWKRQAGQQPPDSFETQAPGWYHDGGKLIPMRGEHGIRMEVGGTYIAPVVYLFGQWGFDESVLEVVGGKVKAAPHQDFELATELNGKSLAEVAQVLSESRPVPDSGPLPGTTEEQLAATGVDIHG